MTYVIVEAIIYITWATVFLTRLRTKSQAATEELLIILFAMPITIIMELKNEYYYAGTGVYYPFSLLYFPDSKFPLAIVLSSSLFPWVLYIVSRWIAARFVGGKSGSSSLLELGLLLLLISTNVLPEWLGASLGYWQWPKTLPLTFTVQIAKYIFYFWFTFPPVLIAKFFTWRLSMQS